MNTQVSKKYAVDLVRHYASNEVLCRVQVRTLCVVEQDLLILGFVRKV